MYQQHRWSFQGVIDSVIDGRTLRVTMDLGFNVYKAVNVILNNIKVKVLYPEINSKETPTETFLKETLTREPALFKIYKTFDRNGIERYYADIYAKTAMSLCDVNKYLKNRENYTNLIYINDLMVKKGLANYTEIYLHNKSTREYNQNKDYIEQQEG